MTHSRRSRLPRVVVFLVAFVAVVVAAWMFIIRDWSAPGDGAAPDGDSGIAATNEFDRDRDRTAGAADAPTPLFTPEPAPVTATPPALIDDRATSASSAPGDATADAPIDRGAALADALTGAPQATPQSAPQSAPPEAPSAPSTSGAALASAITLLTTDPVASRLELTRLLDSSALGPAERLRAYEAINEVNQPLFFRSGIVTGDTVFVQHRVAEGETPVAIVRTLSADCDGDLLLRVNNIADARRIRVGQVLKVPKGTFHGEVRKGEFRLNIFHGEGAERVMIASYPVGLGEFNTTPTGIFKIRPRSKLKNPQWRNPRTGEFFAADDPKNPIGERWVGLEGIEPHNQDFAGYGIHGTIEPDSIGQMRSMGCIRMLAPDVEAVYEMLTVPNSTVLISP